MTCPICETLREGHVVKEGTLCADCNDSYDIKDCWDSLCLMRSLRTTILMFVWGYPLLLIGSMFVVMRDGGSLMWIPGMTTSWGIWAFNVFYLFPRQKIQRGKDDWRVEQAMQDLFVARVAPSK